MGLVRSATTASGTSASPTRWSGPRSTSSWGPPAASCCTRGRPGSSTTRGPRCATGCMAAAPPGPRAGGRAGGLRAAGGRGRGVGRRGVGPPRGEPAERRSRASVSTGCCRAVDAMIGAGDLIQADAFARQAVGFAPGPLRDATMGYLAVLRGAPARRKPAARRLGAVRPRRGPRRRRRGRASGWRCTGWGGCGAARWWSGRGGRWSSPARTIRCGSRPRPCWGWGWAWQGRSAGGPALPTRRSWPGCPTTSACRRSGSGWPRGGCAGRRRRRGGAGPARATAPPRCAPGRSGSRCGRTCGWRGRSSRWGRGMRRRRMRSGRCRCWRSRGMSGCGRWRGVRRCWCRRRGGSGWRRRSMRRRRWRGSGDYELMVVAAGLAGALVAGGPW